ncbi:MAG: hypothetical protein NZM29_01255 [Nitrospira sp.]|nr:hypothetical protein [Nitrospira sp.]
MERQEPRGIDGREQGPCFYWLITRPAAYAMVFLLAGCGAGDDELTPNSPLTTPMALVVNQEETTLTTLRLDGKFSPVVGTLSLGPAEPDAIGGVAFSLGEWIFITHTTGNRVAAIDPIGGPTPILEDFITTNPANPLVRIGRRPTKIYRDPVDKEVLWTTNEGDPDGVDRLAGCTNGGSVSVLHNSHLGVGGGEKPRVTSRVCLSGRGEYFVAFSQPLPSEQEYVFVSSKTTGLVSVLLALPLEGGGVAWSEFPTKIDLCDSVKEMALGYPVCDSTTATPNHSAPAGLFWSQATRKIYGYLSGYNSLIEINPPLFKERAVSLSSSLPAPGATSSFTVGITPDGRELLVIIEDRSDAHHVVTRFGSIDVTVSGPLTLTAIPVPILQDVRIGQFQFTPDGRQVYLLASNDNTGLSPVQASNQRKDVLFVVDRTPFQIAREIALPPATSHAMDLWITGPAGVGSAKGVVVTNATSGSNGTVSLISASSGRIISTFRVGRNPTMVTVYYAGLARSDNQATPRW